MTDQTEQAPEDIGAPVSYLVLPPGTPAYDRSGSPAGTVEHVIADDREDIFHGLVLKTGSEHRYASSSQVDGIFERAVIIAVPAAQLPAPSADPAAQSVTDNALINELKRAWTWLVRAR